MSNDFAERMYKATRGRHLAKIRELAETIQVNAGRVLNRMDQGCQPRTFDLPDDAYELARRIEIVAAIDEMHDMYLAQEAAIAREASTDGT